MSRNEYVVHIDGQEATLCAHFHYLGSIIHQDGGIE